MLRLYLTTTIFLTGTFFGGLVTAIRAADPTDGKLHIIVFGAHPDDAELKAGGAAIQWAKQGHHVKFVSVTNRDIGHWRMHGEPLAKRRPAEARAAQKKAGGETAGPPLSDGELGATP